MITFECSGCDITVKSAPDTLPPDSLPKGWHRQISARLGDMFRCPACSAKNAVKIATSTMTTEEILNHKSGDEWETVTVATSAQKQLKTYLERFNRLFDEMQALSEDVSELKKEAKELGFDTKILIKVVRESRKDQATRQVEKEIFELYASAVGLE